MKRVIELRREKGSYDRDWKRANGADVLCNVSLITYYNIPDEATKLTVTLSTTETKESLRVKCALSPLSNRVNGLYVDEKDNNKWDYHCTFHSADLIMTPFFKSTGKKVFFVSFEYE